MGALRPKRAQNSRSRPSKVVEKRHAQEVRRGLDVGRRAAMQPEGRKKKEKRGDEVGCDDVEPFPIGNYFQASRANLRLPGQTGGLLLCATAFLDRTGLTPEVDTWTPECARLRHPVSRALGRDDPDRRVMIHDVLTVVMMPIMI